MKVSVLALAMLWAAGVALAQTPSTPPPADSGHGIHNIERLATLLDLNDTQKAQVQAILQQQHAKMHDLFAQAKASGTKPSFEQMHALHEQLHQDTIQKLTPVLTDTQLKKFEILMEDMGPRHGFGAHGHPGSDAN